MPIIFSCGAARCKWKERSPRDQGARNFRCLSTRRTELKSLHLSSALVNISPLVRVLSGGPRLLRTCRAANLLPGGRDDGYGGSPARL